MTIFIKDLNLGNKMKHKIVVKNACKRREGYAYHIDSEGNLIEEKSWQHAQDTESMPGPSMPAENTFSDTDDKEEQDAKVRGTEMSDNDIKLCQAGIRTGVLKNLIKIWFKDLDIPGIMKELKVSRRTAYDYAKAAQVLISRRT